MVYFSGRRRHSRLVSVTGVQTVLFRSGEWSKGGRGSGGGVWSREGGEWWSEGRVGERSGERGVGQEGGDRRMGRRGNEPRLGS